MKVAQKHTQILAVASIVAFAAPGCGLFPLPGGTTGNGNITVSRIITTDPPNVTTDITLPLSTALTDGLGFRWDVQDDGTVIDGGSTDFPDAFDTFMVYELRVHGFGEHEFDPGISSAKLEDGREIVIGPIAQEGGLSITRKIFVSPDHGFCRWLDILENTSDTDLEVESENRGNLGSDEANNDVFISSDGNTTLEADDQWWINGQQFATDPTIGAFFTGIEDLDKTQDEITFDYGEDQAIPAHSRHILATFLFQRSPDRNNPQSLLTQEVGVVSDLQTTLTSMQTFPAVDSSFLVGMTADEVNDLRDVGGNVKAIGAAGSVAANADVTITNTTNGDTRGGTANADGSFGPLNVKGVAGDTIQITAGSQNFTQTVP